MERRHQGQHGDDCFGCRIQSVQVSPAAMPTRTRNTPPARPQHNAWERGIVKDERGLPVLRNGREIGLKEYAGDQKRIDRDLRALKQGHDPSRARERVVLHE